MVMTTTTSMHKTAHPYLKGNYAPVRREHNLTACRVAEGAIPDELSGGQYVRNGGNPLTNEDDQRSAHWFDGDGMLTGVLFQRGDGKDSLPHFINRYILTDVLLSTSTALRRPFLPSIATFAAPVSVFEIPLLLLNLMRTVFLVLLTWLPFQATPALTKISVANTSVYWHDGKAFAGCESGPPMRILLPGLETAGWWTGNHAEGSEGGVSTRGFAKGVGPIKMLNEFTTAHPRVDPRTNELLLYHMSFVAPFLRVSVIPPRSSPKKALLAASVPGLKQPKLAHDFCATSSRTILIDLPLVLDPRNLLRGKPMLEYDGKQRTRFALMPRWQPEKVTWFETEPCCIYHAANAWDNEKEASTNVLACRLNSATLVYSAGNLPTPSHAQVEDGGAEKCQLYYWQLRHPHSTDQSAGIIECEFPLSDIPLEFPTMNETYSQESNQFVYGASMTSGTFDAGLGTRSAKIDCLVKADVKELIKRGKRRCPKGVGSSVDSRSVAEILRKGKNDESDPIRIFALPPHHYAQEATFIPRQAPQSEDDGYLVFFVFNEASGLDEHGDCRPEAASQLWIIDARNMRDVLCKVQLPQRVPYGLHGHFFSEEDIQSQVPVPREEVRTWALSRSGHGGPGMAGAKQSLQSASTGGGRIHSLLSYLTFTLRSTVESYLA